MSWVTQDRLDSINEHLAGIKEEVRDLMIVLEVMGIQDGRLNSRIRKIDNHRAFAEASMSRLGDDVRVRREEDHH
jgi:hypothetical protein